MTDSTNYSLAESYAILTASKARPKGKADFTLSLRAAVRGLWAGRLDMFGFTETMIGAFQRHFEVAWREGAATCGIRPDERTEEETKRLSDLVNDQIPYVLPLGEYIQENNKAEGGLLRVPLKRLPPWINRYDEVKAIAQLMACGNTKLVWRLGKTVEHCKTCLKLNGRVMRASRWKELDIWPQDTRPGKLDCHGFNCDCRLEKTEKRATPGKLPRLS